ncbi:autotransporter domain-containing protein [Campylobacter gastrosuis]|uniref:Autotransporter domain-containing protein n=1 Tax=Campylobacter gastrosuis TaxID=2974576 RepID=A0ABT7HQ13_9BACT|nr:autotransporter domain-containing protein [Campylobacter gastrosuis]MDL0088713.1 autotransporter domain-containing protein [Campylobacter gastrosuis]
MKFSRVVCSTLFGVLLGFSTLGAANLTLSEAVEKNLNAYNNFFVGTLQKNVSNFSEVLSSYNDGIKNVTSDSLNNGKDKALGDLLKGLMSAMNASDTNGFSYKDYGTNVDDESEEDSGGWVEVEDKQYLEFSDSESSKARITYGKNSIKIYGDVSDSANDYIALKDDGTLVLTTQNNGQNSILANNDGLLKSDLDAINALLKGVIDDRVSYFKKFLIIDGFRELIYSAINDETLRESENFKNLMNEFNKISSYDEMKNIATQDIQTTQNALSKTSRLVELITSVKNASQSDKAAKISELNSYMSDNGVKIGVDNDKTYDGFSSVITESTDIDKILGIVKTEKKNYENNVDVVKVVAENLVKNEKLFKEIILDKELSDDTKKVLDQAKAELEATQTATEKKAGLAAISAKLAKLNANKNTTNEEKAQAQSELSKAQKDYTQAVAAKIEAIANNSVNTALLATDKSVALGISDALTSSNLALVSALDSDSVSEFSQIVKDVTNSIDTANQSLNTGITTDIVKFSSDLSTNTRLAKLSNPFNDNLALAYAISELKGEKFADSGDSLSSVVKAYTDRFNYDHNLWANVLGSKGKLKGDIKPSLYGFSIGYDKAFDNSIVGVFATSAKSKIKADAAKNEANNYQFGLYSRAYFGNSEIDAKISIGKAKNELDRYNVLGNASGKYDTDFFSTEFGYGYVFDLSKTMFIKPFASLNYNYLKNKAFNENGVLPLHFDSTKTKSLSIKLGSEFRGYVNETNYLYIAPNIEREIYKDTDDTNVRFLGSNQNIFIENDDKKHTYFGIQTGADFAITQSLSTNINFGAKLRSNEKYYNGTIGLRYKF